MKLFKHILVKVHFLKLRIIKDKTAIVICLQIRAVFFIAVTVVKY